MKARDISGQSTGGKRTMLAEKLPLRTPFIVQIFPVYACNFSCIYCVFSVDKAKRGFISDKEIMDLGLYKKCVDDITAFPDKLKVLRFVGMGEPLLHKDIAEMVRDAVLKDIADRTEIITNASLLSPKMSDSLISAGLSQLIVSLQGTTEDKYRQVCGKKSDFKNIVNNLRYFYENKGSAHLYIKIVDCALDSEDDKRRFYEIFGDICDTMAIEHVGRIFPGVAYGKVLGKKEPSLTQFGLPLLEVRICPQPFFTLQINPDGKVVPCYSIAYPRIMGDCNNQSVCDIWNGTEFRRFRLAMLDSMSNASDICANCGIIRHRMFPEDCLDDHAERLKRFYAS